MRVEMMKEALALLAETVESRGNASESELTE